jgi:hypothetical protein
MSKTASTILRTLLLIGMLGFGAAALWANYTVSPSSRSVKGVREVIPLPISIAPDSKKSAPLATNFTTTPASQNELPNTTSPRLEGKGCQSTNDFPTTCKLVYNDFEYFLKRCTENDMASCNSYNYALGSSSNSGFSILRSYEENGDKILDIHVFNPATSGYSFVISGFWEELKLGQNKGGNCSNSAASQFYSKDCWSVTQSSDSNSQIPRLDTIRKSNQAYQDILTQYQL